MEHERGYFNEAADRLMNTLIGTERELKSWQDKLVDHIDTATSKIDTSNWNQKKEDDKERHLFTPADAWQEGCDSDPDWETKKIAEAKRLSREVLLELTTTRKENDNE